MARDDDDFETRRRRREEEDEREREAARPRPKPGAIKRPGAPDDDPTVGKADELMARAEPLIEQLNNLYNMYIAGVEKRPPVERRQMLEQIMTTLQLMGKPTQALRFKYTSLHASYISHRDRWDRLCKELESGKRAAGKPGGRR